MPTGKHPWSNFFLFIMALSVMLEVCRVHGCWTGFGSECEVAPFVPGHNLAGEGFDVVRMRRTGAYVINVKAHLADNHTCTLCPNRFQQGQIQKVPATVVDWRPFSRCSKHLTSALHHSVDSLLRSSNSLVDNNWYLDLGHDKVGKLMVGGSRSDLAKFAHSQHRVDKATFALHEISCTFYNYRLADHPQLSTEFTKHLNRLPKSLKTSEDKEKYRHLIDTYGTHYIHRVQLGGRVRRITAFRTCLAFLKGFSESEIKECLNFGLKIALGFLSAEASFYTKCNNLLKETMSMSTAYNQVFMTHNIEVIGGERYFPDILYQQNPSEAYRSWMNSLHDNPDVVSYAIFPLHHLVEDSQIRANLRSIITDHIEANQVEQPAPKSCYETSHVTSDCCPKRVERGTLRLEIERAEDLYADLFSQADAYVKIFYDGIYKETYMVLDDDNPEWDVYYNFGSVEVGFKLRFEIWDSDMYNDDDKLGSCYVYTESGSHSIECHLNPGVFYFTYSITCEAYLTGDLCELYSPTG